MLRKCTQSIYRIEKPLYGCLSFIKSQNVSELLMHPVCIGALLRHFVFHEASLGALYVP